MNCPHCQKQIEDKKILHEAARINGRKGRRKLTPEQARKMQAASAEARRKKRK